jgi:hypothetical protein
MSPSRGSAGRCLPLIARDQSRSVYRCSVESRRTLRQRPAERDHRNHAGTNRYAAQLAPNRFPPPPTGLEKLTLVRFLTRRQSNGSTASGTDLEVATSTKPP